MPTGDWRPNPWLSNSANEEFQRVLDQIEILRQKVGLQQDQIEYLLNQLEEIQKRIETPIFKID